MIFGIDTFLDKLSQQIDRITQMYVDPEKPYDSPKIIRVSLETIKQKFFSKQHIKIIKYFLYNLNYYFLSNIS